MKKIIYGLILLIIILSVLLAGCSTCPSSCDDNNICTTDFCSNQTDYKCEHKKITNCCLSDEDCSTNKVCENNKCEYSNDFLTREAVKVAQGFSIAWQQENYANAYDFIDPALQSLRNKQEFIKFVKSSQELSKFILIYDKVVLQNKDLAYAYYSFSGESVFQPKTPAIEMNWINGEWRINGLNDYFINKCVVSSCSDEIENTLNTVHLTLDLETSATDSLPQMPYLVSNDTDKVLDAVAHLRGDCLSAVLRCYIEALEGKVLDENSCEKNAKSDSIKELISNMNFKCDSSTDFKCSIS